MMAESLDEPKRGVFYWIFRGKTRLTRLDGEFSRHISRFNPEPLPMTGLLSAVQEEITLKKAAKSLGNSDHPREIRHRRGLNQQQFWPLIGVTQSGGSRYESGRRMPKPVRELLRIVHVEGIPLAQVRGDDFALLQYLKKARSGLYRELKAAAVRERKQRR